MPHIMSQLPQTLTIAFENRFCPIFGRYLLDEFREHGPQLIPCFSEDPRQRDAAVKQQKDPWEARALLLDTREGTTDFTAFTKAYGQFGPFSAGDLQFSRGQLGRLRLERHQLSQHLLFASSGRATGMEKAGQALEADFQEWRELLRAAMTRKMANWSSLIGRFPRRKVSLLRTPFPFEIEWRKAVPVAITSPRNAVQAVITSIQIDMLRGSKFRYCARKRCGKVFELKSRHDRIYCGYPCAHLVAVAKSRTRNN